MGIPIKALFSAFLFIITLSFHSVAFGQDVPEDFEITLTSAPNLLSNSLEKESIVIRADGSAWFSARLGDDGPLPEAEGQLPAEAVETIYRVVQERGFFELNSSYTDPQIIDGDYAEITVTANGVSHQVRTQNVSLFDFDLIAMTINARVPDDRRVIYNALISGNSREIER